MADSESEHNSIHRNFYIPTYILAPNASSNSLRLPDVPTCPVLVFVNSKSGGQLGGELLRTFRHLLNKYQVFDLGEEAPDSVLRRLYLNIERLKGNGDRFAAEIEERMRIIVEMARLAGFSELYLISNYLSHLQLQQYLWELETTFHLLLAGERRIQGPTLTPSSLF